MSNLPVIYFDAVTNSTRIVPIAKLAVLVSESMYWNSIASSAAKAPEAPVVRRPPAASSAVQGLQH